MKKLMMLICAGIVAASVAGCSGGAEVENTASENTPQVTEQKEVETQTASEEITQETVQSEQQKTEQAE